MISDGDRHFHGAVGAGQVVEVVCEVPHDGTPVVLPHGRERIKEGREVVDRPRSQVPVEQLAELGDLVTAVRQEIIAAVLSCRASQDRSRQSTRPCTPGGKGHQTRQGGEAGREGEVVFEDQPVSQLLPYFGVVLELRLFQKRGDSIGVPVGIVHLRPVHHLGIKAPRGRQPGLPVPDSSDRP
ncbi:hypothetical protein EF908_13240 [Streptomyces sp. WAC04770]|nr:hypothetical protein [Streptomyces sp. WAC04770]RST23028.1 hypothetical protein EF908_13240 [Streptomyces sp. WAC04770]